MLFTELKWCRIVVRYDRLLTKFVINVSLYSYTGLSLNLKKKIVLLYTFYILKTSMFLVLPVWDFTFCILSYLARPLPRELSFSTYVIYLFHQLFNLEFWFSLYKEASRQVLAHTKKWSRKYYSSAYWTVRNVTKWYVCAPVEGEKFLWQAKHGSRIRLQCMLLLPSFLDFLLDDCFHRRWFRYSWTCQRYVYLNELHVSLTWIGFTYTEFAINTHTEIKSTN